MNGKQEIGISELARMLGITPEAIRKYEEKEIVQVRRNDNNRYRRYSVWEIYSILHARRFSQMGLSLNQAAELLKTSDDRAYIHEIEMLQMRLAKEISFKKSCSRALRRKRKNAAAP